MNLIYRFDVWIGFVIIVNWVGKTILGCLFLG